jgi:hypothetical protein
VTLWNQRISVSAVTVPLAPLHQEGRPPPVLGAALLRPGPSRSRLGLRLRGSRRRGRLLTRRSGRDELSYRRIDLGPRRLRRRGDRCLWALGRGGAYRPMVPRRSDPGQDRSDHDQHREHRDDAGSEARPVKEGNGFRRLRRSGPIAVFGLRHNLFPLRTQHRTGA